MPWYSINFIVVIITKVSVLISSQGNKEKMKKMKQKFLMQRNSYKLKKLLASLGRKKF